jgi:hypothetical protein
MHRHSSAVLSAVAVLAFAGSAQASLFSMASDIDQASWTFAGFGSSVTDAQDPFDPQVLLIDDNNGASLPVAFQSEFGSQLQLTYLSSTPLFGNTFTHLYTISGTFSFLDPTTSTGLTASITGGVLAVVGSTNSWGSTATIQASDTFGAVGYQWNAGDLPQVGIFNGSSIGLDDAAFTLTNLGTGIANSGVSIDSDTKLPTANWFAEGSFSGSGVFVPSPASVVMLGAGAIIAGFRRRA